MSNTSTENIALPAACPLCSSPLAVREVECTGCGVLLRGRFERSATAAARYQDLSPEQAVFLETFLRCRGVIRDVEAALGISYPTVRGRLDALLQRLGLAERPAPTKPDDGGSGERPSARSPSVTTEEILHMLDAGALDPAAAIDALKKSRIGSDATRR